MAEVVHVVEGALMLAGETYRAQVVGRRDGHLWEGWIEFLAADRSSALRTPRETTQPDRDALQYWATGLSATYLEGALQRALRPPNRIAPPAVETPFFDAPAPPPATAPPGERAVLDPFSVGAKGASLLRQELGALRGWHLRNIVRAYALAAPDTDLEALSEPELVELIVLAVRDAERAGA